MNPLFEAHFAKLVERHPGATRESGPVGLVVNVPGLPTEPSGAWNMPATDVAFVAPVGYPQAQPDCFFAHPGLRLGSGALPANTAENMQLGRQALWFSWHVARWNPRTDTLLTYVNVIRDRLRQAK